MASTSAAASAEASPGVLKEIQDLFDWSPPALIPSVKKSTTTTTRPPFFDKHFSDEYVLKKVQRLTTLIHDLDEIVNKALNEASDSLPPLNTFSTAKQRKLAIGRIDLTAPDEKAVANFYNMTTAQYCPYVASTLALHPKASSSNWLNLLSWTQSTSSSGYAIMDGQLCLIQNFGIKEQEETFNEITDKIVMDLDIFKEMKDSREPFATWEFKSLATTGSVDVMKSVPDLGEFNWKKCTECGDDTIKKNLQKAVDNVKNLAVGCDMRDPPWLKSSDDSLSTVTATGSKYVSPVKKKGKKREQDSTKKKRKKRRLDVGVGDGDGDGNDDGNSDDETYQPSDRHNITAQSLVQQAWAQAVQVDGTFIVLHSGNHELVCIRHRRTQTLYVSDTIVPSQCQEPGYGKLHIGIYVASIQDTIDRKEQQQQKLSQKTLPGDGGEDQGDQDQDGNRGSGSRDKGGPKHGRGKRGGRGSRKSSRLQGSSGKTGPTDAIEKAIHMASSLDVVFLYLQYGIYDSPVPASFLRSAPSLIANAKFCPRPINTYGLKECLNIILTSEIGNGATGHVLHGTLESEVDCVMPLDVVVKLALDFEQQDALRSEYEFYRRLKGVSKGIVTPFGFFDDYDCTTMLRVLL